MLCSYTTTACSEASDESSSEPDHSSDSDYQFPTACSTTSDDEDVEEDKDLEVKRVKRSGRASDSTGIQSTASGGPPRSRQRLDRGIGITEPYIVSPASQLQLADEAEDSGIPSSPPHAIDTNHSLFTSICSPIAQISADYPLPPYADGRNKKRKRDDARAGAVPAARIVMKKLKILRGAVKIHSKERLRRADAELERIKLEQLLISSQL